MKAIKKIALLLIALLVITPVVPAQAGTIEKDSSLLVDGQLNSTDWFDAEDSTYMEEDKLHFPADGFGNTRVISKSIAQEDLAYKNMFTLSAQVQITELPENEKFIFAIGLDSIEAFSGEPGNIEIEITNNGSLQMGVVYYEENGNASVIAEPKAIGVQVGDFFTVTLRADTARNLDIAVNGVTVFAFTEISSLEGRIGFLKTGHCGAYMSEATAEFTHYDRPENPNLTENFETEIYNNNLFTTNFISYARYPAYIAVEEQEGNSTLRFYNTKLGYFGTKYAYSNFELTFDVPHYYRNMIKDENGKLLAAPTMEFLVSVGDDAMDFGGFGYATSVEAIRFTKDTVHGLNHDPEKFRVNYVDKGYCNVNTNEGFSVLVRMVDGHLELGMKALDAEEFDIIARADYEDFRTGYIKIWSVNDGNFEVDNIQITNLDDNANLTDVEFQSAAFVSENYDYQPPQLVFRPQEQTNTDADDTASWDWMPVIVAAAVSAVIILSAVVVSAGLKKRKKKEAA